MALESKIAQLENLDGAARLRFLSHLAHGLTISLRVFINDVKGGAPSIDSARVINESSHIVTRQITEMVSGRDSNASLQNVVRQLFSSQDAQVMEQVLMCWNYAEKNSP